MDGHKLLAFAVIQTAVDDFKDRRKSRFGNRLDAGYFLRGGKGSTFDFWCEVIGLNRVASQEELKVFKGVK